MSANNKRPLRELTGAELERRFLVAVAQLTPEQSQAVAAVLEGAANAK